MKFKNIKPDSETGNINFDVECSQNEVSYLVNYAVQDLLSTGIIAINDLNEEQEVSLRDVAH